MSSIQEPCQRCGRIVNLEVCFNTYQKVCRNCLIEHFRIWKQEQLPICSKIEANLDFYKREIGKKNNTFLIKLIKLTTQP